MISACCARSRLRGDPLSSKSRVLVINLVNDDRITPRRFLMLEIARKVSSRDIDSTKIRAMLRGHVYVYCVETRVLYSYNNYQYDLIVYDNDNNFIIIILNNMNDKRLYPTHRGEMLLESCSRSSRRIPRLGILENCSGSRHHLDRVDTWRVAHRVDTTWRVAHRVDTTWRVARRVDTTWRVAHRVATEDND